MVSSKLIPRDVLFGNPDKKNVSISPDGSQISFLAPWKQTMNLWVAPVNQPEDAERLTSDTHRGISRYHWTYREDTILLLDDSDGDENWQIVSLDVKTGEQTELTPVEDVQARIVGMSPRHPDTILVGLNDRDPEVHDIYKLSLPGGDRESILQNDKGFTGFVADRNLEVRIGVNTKRDGRAVLETRDGSTWSPFIEIPPEDVMTTQPIGYDDPGETLYMLDSREHNVTGLFAVDPETGTRTLLSEHERADADRVTRDPQTLVPQAVQYNYLRRNWDIIDSDVREDLSLLEEKYRGDLSILARSRDKARWVVAWISDAKSIRYGLYRRKKKEVQHLFFGQEDLNEQPLVSMTPTRFTSEDDLELVSYISLPDQHEEATPGNLPGEAPFPAVLNVHGGPWARDSWGYDPHHQWLANRGYAVLSVNYRGSSGFGKDFLRAGDGEWAGKMHRDLLNAVDEAGDKGYIDPDRVAIMGGSYGGFATLVGMTFTPERFCCGINICGPSNLITFIQDIPPYWRPILPVLRERLGADPSTEEGQQFLYERSPISRVDEIRKPLLMGHGANDPRVKKSEAEQLVDEMNRKDIPVTYLEYPDEGHGFERPENRLSFYAVTEAFLARHLGGHRQPPGDDFEGSSLRVMANSGHLPELENGLE